MRLIELLRAWNPLSKLPVPDFNHYYDEAII
jgi:hypothetical protein